jgi:phosphatidylglycerophosphate synthase
MVRTVAAAGVIAQAVVLAALGGTVGLSAVGWVAGVACGLAANAAVQRGLRRSDARTMGPANWVTLTRATLVGGVAALVAQSFVRPLPVTTLVALAALALALDAVDGWVARRTASASPFGARFDMEVDAFLIFVLSVEVARSVGPWVLVIGAARYAFVAAGWLLPWLRDATPPRYWCKCVAAIQGVVLTVAVADVLPTVWNEVALAAALALLTESFGRDVWWLWSQQRRQARRRVERRAVARVASS